MISKSYLDLFFYKLLCKLSFILCFINFYLMVHHLYQINYQNRIQVVFLKVLVEGLIVFWQLLITFVMVVLIVLILVHVLIPHFHNLISNLLIILHFSRYLIIFEFFISMLQFFIWGFCSILKYEGVQDKVVMRLTWGLG